MTLEAIVFDCDGVLFESISANLAFYNSVLRRFGADEVCRDDAEQVRLCHTANSAVVFSTLLGPQRGAEALAYALNLGYEQFIPHMQPEPGVEEALATLASQLPLGVATNRGGSIHPILEHFSLTRHFRAVISVLDVERPKPWPDMLWLAAERLGVAVERILFVGDSELDRQAAQAAGAQFIAYKADDLQAQQRVDSHTELLALVAASK